MVDVLERAAKKGKQILNGLIPDDGPVEPFYIDLEAKKQLDKSSTDVLNKLNAICQVWASIVKKPIASLDEFKSIIAGPAKHYRAERVSENIEQQKPHTLAYLEEGFTEEAIQPKIKLPEDFDRIQQLVKDLKPDDIQWKNFTWDATENSFHISQHFLNRVDGKVYFSAISPLQKKRLTLARKMMDVYKEIDSLLTEEAKEAGIKQSRIDDTLRQGRFYGPIPYCLRFIQRPERGNFFNPSLEIAINHEWVITGHARYQDVIGLTLNKPAPRPDPKPIIYLKYQRTDGDGARRLYIVPKDAKNNAYYGSGIEANVKFLPGEFVLEPVSGKLTPYESDK